MKKSHAVTVFAAATLVVGFALAALSPSDFSITVFVSAKTPADFTAASGQGSVVSPSQGVGGIARLEADPAGLPIDPAKIPLILIHGLHGNQQDGSDTLQNLNRDYWGTFLGYFQGRQELTDRYQVYLFYYRSDVVPVAELGQRLGGWLDSTISNKPHVLLAHGMGGLVARWYMQKYRHQSGAWAGRTGGDTALRLITLATPHHGSPLVSREHRNAISTDGYAGVFNLLDELYWQGVLAPSNAADPKLPNRADLLWSNYDFVVDPQTYILEENALVVGLNLDQTYDPKIFAFSGFIDPLDPRRQELIEENFSGLDPPSSETLMRVCGSGPSRCRQDDPLGLLVFNILMGRGLLDGEYGVFRQNDGFVPRASAQFAGHRNVNQVGPFLNYDHLDMLEGKPLGAGGSGTPASNPLFETIRYYLENLSPYLTVFPHFGDGDGISSTVILTNPSPTETATGEVKLYRSDGAPLSVDVNGVVRDGSFGFSVPPGRVGLYRTDGSGALQAGSVVVESDAPVGGSILFSGGFGVAGVGPAQPSTQFSIPVEVRRAAGISTGVAVSNSMATEVEIRLELHDQDGFNVSGDGVRLVLPTRGQIARFVEELFAETNVEFSDFLGTVRVFSPVPVHAMAIRTSPGQFATLTVGPAGEESRNLNFPHFGDGAGVSSTLILTNPSPTQTATGEVRLFRSDGTPLTVEINGVVRSGSFPFSIAPGGVGFHRTDGLGELQTGWVFVESDNPVGGSILFSGGFGVAGVAAARSANRFIVPVEADAAGISTGVALSNPHLFPVSVSLRLSDGDGRLISELETSLSGQAQNAMLVEDLFRDSGIDFSSFRGALEIRSLRNASGQLPIDGLAIRVSPGEYATLPATPFPNDLGEPVYNSGLPGITVPSLLVQTTPRYTDEAINAGVQGIVLLECIVRANGRFTDFSVLRSLGFGLEEAAISLIEDTWRAKPAELNGVPVNLFATIEISYSLR